MINEIAKYLKSIFVIIVNTEERLPPGIPAIRQGINADGNRYICLEDGGFIYTNFGPDGQVISRYYDTGDGFRFFCLLGPDGYHFVENGGVRHEFANTPNTSK